MKPIYSAIALAFLVGCSGPSPQELSEASKACKEFVGKEMTIRAFPGLETEVLDSWSKNGALVLEVGYREKTSSSEAYRVRLCVYDKKRGNISLPSVLDTSWRK